MKKTLKQAPGQAPPRGALLVAAVTVAVLLHAAVFGLFHRQTAQGQLLATPWIQEQLAQCQTRPGRAERQQCQRAVAQRARIEPDVTVVAQP
jgi:hypothetical protein